MRHVHRWTTQAGRAIRQAVRGARRWLRWVLTRVVNEPGYLEAIAALAVAVAELLCRNHGVRRLVHETARTVVIVIRALLRPDADDATSAGPRRGATHEFDLGDEAAAWV